MSPPIALLPGRLLPTLHAAGRPSQLERGLAGLGDVRAGGQPMLAKAVLPSFIALRRAVIDASGHDFLARLSEANRADRLRQRHVVVHQLAQIRARVRHAVRLPRRRPAGAVHLARTAGRAAVLAAVPAGGAAGWQPGPADHAAGVQPEQPHALTAAQQATSWISPRWRPQHGWRRIAAQERENFDWRSELLALEYWHFERRDGLSWYGAVSLVYDDYNAQAPVQRRSAQGRRRARGRQSRG